MRRWMTRMHTEWEAREGIRRKQRVSDKESSNDETQWKVAEVPQMDGQVNEPMQRQLKAPLTHLMFGEENKSGGV